MRTIRLVNAALLLLTSVSLYAADRPFADPSAPPPLRVVPLDGIIEGAEADVLIELRERPLLESRGRARANSEASSETLDALLARLDADLRRIEKRPDSGPRAASAESPLRFRYKLTFAGASAHVSRQAVDAIRALPYVKAVHLDRRMEAHVAKSVPSIRAGEVWETYGVRGKGIVVAVIDTGIDYTHPALGKLFPGTKVAGGYDFVNLDDDPMDDNGHGTHVAGIIAGNAAPVVGVAPEATLLAYKVLDKEGKGKASNIIAAIERAMDPDGNGDVSDRADVVNISLGGPRSLDDPLVAAVERGVAAGAVFCLSAGNEYTNAAIGSPAMAPSAITVGALSLDGIRAFFSSRGPVGGTWDVKPEIGAPGMGILSAKRGGGTIAAGGTSMAAPHIAGVAALILQKHPGWTPADVKAAIVSTGKPAYTNTEDPQPSVVAAAGGRVDARAAIEATILPSPAVLSFGILPKWNAAFSATRTVRLTNRGTASETVTITPPVLTDGAKLIVTPAAVTIAPGGDAELTFALQLPAATPGPNDDDVALAGTVEMQTGRAPLHVPWQLVNAPVVSVTFGGTDDVAMVMTTRGDVPVTWPEGPRTAGALLKDSHDVAIAAFFQPPSDLGRLVVLEDQPVQGYTKLTASPEQAIHKVVIAGADENGVPFSSLIGTDGVVSTISREFFLWQFQLVDFSIFDSQLREFLVSPLKNTGLRVIEVLRKPEAKYATMYRILWSIEKDEVLQTLPGDWASQTVQYDCLKPTCDASLAPGAGSLGLFWAHGVGKGPAKWKLFLTPRVAEQWDFRAYVIVREETAPPDASSGIMPWTYLSPALRNDGGRLTASPFGRKTVADYVSPSTERPILIGDGPVVLRTIMSQTRVDFEPFGAAIGESIGEKIEAVKVKLFDAAGEEQFIAPRYPGRYRAPKDTGAYRLLLTTDYGIAGQAGRVTQTSNYDKAKHPAAPTLTMLRVEDGGGNATWSVAAGSAAKLTFSARHSSYDAEQEFYILHRVIDENATRVWWRRHGTEEWIPIPVSKTGSDYSIRGSLPGTAGTIYSGDLRAAAAVPGKVDLKVLVASTFGATTEVVYEPALIVEEAQPKRRAVR